MSYILDALRKSDQQRHQGAAPTLASVPLPVQEPRRRIVPWLGALAAVLFIMGVGIGWWLPWQPESPPPDRTPAHPPEAGAALRPRDPSWEMGSPLQAHSQAKDVLVAVAPPVSDAKQTVPDAANTTAPAATAEGRQREHAVSAPIAPLAHVPAGAEVGSSAAEWKTTAKPDLPAAIQMEIPKMAVSLHAYSSNSANRLVVVNDQLLHEGDALAPGLVLEQITPGDMVFGYKGFRFRQGVR